jgi:hypothetical protein
MPLRLRAEPLMRLLTYAGLIPFVAATIAVWLGEAGAQFVLQSYGAIILSFLGGIHWGRALGAQNIHAIPLLISSNVMALVAWLSLLLTTPYLIYSILMACFAIQYQTDRALTKLGIITPAFLRLRAHATLGVLGCLAAALIHTLTQ